MATNEKEAFWREFKAQRDVPSLPPCPFCGIRHEWGKTHPFCDMASTFNDWWEWRNTQ